MAHPNLHLAVGLSVGMAFGLPRVALAWARNRPLARPIRDMLLASFALALFAVVPNALNLGGTWTNLFVAHAALSAWRPNGGGLLIGELVISTLLVFDYLLVMAAVIRVRWRQRHT